MTYLGSVDRKIVNGIAIDELLIPTQQCTTIAVPNDAVVLSDARLDTCLVVLIKELHLAGHPPDKITIDEMRLKMGCAKLIDNDAMVIGTYGAYAVEGHGGATVAMKIVAPQHLKVVRRDGLSGTDSVPNRIWQQLRSTAGNATGIDSDGNAWFFLPGSPAAQ